MKLELCAHCTFGFHKAAADGTAGCGCRGYGCGCRIKREAAK